MVSKALFSSAYENWGTPRDVFLQLDMEFEFQTDACTTSDNPLGCKYFYTKENNGLKHDWIGNTYVNPPYGKSVHLWLEKGVEQIQIGRDRNRNIVFLLPLRAPRWFHKYIYDSYSRKWWTWVREVRFVDKRLTFVGAKNSAPFDNIVVVFGN